MAFNTLKLAELMKMGRYTQARLAREMGKTPRTISRWLQGKNIPHDADIRKIAQILQCDPADFYDHYIDMPDESVAIHAVVSVAAHNAYEAMGLAYNVTQRDIIEIAPVLFAVVAGHALLEPARKIAACEAAVAAGIHATIVGSAEEAAGFQLDRQAAQERKCFGIPAQSYDETPNNLFYDALLRLCSGLEDFVDPTHLHYPGAGQPLKAVGFNVDPDVMSYVANHDQERLHKLLIGRLRLPKLKALPESVLDEFLQAQEETRKAATAKRRADFTRWEAAYETAHPAEAAEYRTLVGLLCEDEATTLGNLSPEEREDRLADPFKATLKRSNRYSRRRGPDVQDIDAKTRRLTALLDHRAASQTRFLEHM